MFSKYTPLKNVKDGTSLMKVFVRIKPNDSLDSLSAITAHGNSELSVDDGNNIFSFDGIFNEEATQEAVFTTSISPLLEKAQDGHNISIIAYGLTGSGKTYTMGMGPTAVVNSEGIVQRVIRYLLTPSSNNDKENASVLKMNFLEVYDKTVYDLLSGKKEVTVKGDGSGGVIPVGHREEIVENCGAAVSLLQKCNNLRIVSSTKMNSQSSRSHAILTLHWTNKKNDAYLKFVDLAGAEGVGRHNMGGQGFSEGVSINKGLLAVGKVLNALSSTTTCHIPYREALLTKLLKDTLGGGSHTVMIACISSNKDILPMTVNTLRYAEQARNIRSKLFVPSTIKKNGAKRHSEDVSATPDLWRKKCKTDHNATIATPGHKAPKSRRPFLNNTFATPLQPSRTATKASLKRGPLSSSRLDVSCLGGGGPLPKPIFEEEDDSPSRFSAIEPLHESSQFPVSPFMERINSKLEQSMMLYQERFHHGMRDIEDRIAHRVASLLLDGKTRRRSQRLMKKEPLSEGVISAEEENSPPGATTLADSVAKSLLKDNKLFHILQNTIQPNAQQKMTRNPLLDIRANSCRTSTAIKSNRIIRRSVRLSRKVTEATKITKDQDLDFGFSFQNGSCNLRSESPVLDESTISFSSGISPDFGSSRFQDPNDITVVSSHKNIDLSMPIRYNDPDVKIITEVRDNLNILNEGSSNRFKVPPSPLEIRRSSPTHVQSEFSPLKIRRSTRRSALACTLRNTQLLTNESPLVTKRKRRSIKLNKNTSLLNTTMQRTVLPDVLSPGLKSKHVEEVLKILNTGSLRDLQKLPTVGPKTAMVIHNYRKLYGRFDTINDFEIPSLPKSYFSRFCRANMIN